MELTPTSICILLLHHGQLLLAHLQATQILLFFLGLLFLQVQLIHHFLRVIVNIVIKIGVFISNFSHSIIEFPLLFQISVLIVVGLALEVGAFVVLHGLPSAANLLHDLEGSHVWIGFNYLGSRLNI